MPSFTFSCSNDKSEIDEMQDRSQCIVPKGFEGIRGETNSKFSHLKWHCGAHAPMDHHKSHRQGFAFLIGEALGYDSDSYLSAAQLFDLVTTQREQAATTLARFSGFFAWVVVLDDETVYCGSDPFGFFPVYYFQGKNTIGIATSLNALHMHADYDRSIDPVGFCRYLLENGCSSARTLEKSGKRLNIAESISYDPNTGTLHKQQHVQPGHDTPTRIHDLNDAIKLSIDASSKAVKRHIQRPVSTCLLSGGLDSRHVLSIAHTLGQSPKCLTLGVRHTFESIHARKVAKKLNLPWECSGGYRENPPEMLDDELNLLALGGGFNGILFWWRKNASIQGTRCLTGLFLDITYTHILADKTKFAGNKRHDFAANTLTYSFGIDPDEMGALFNNDEYKHAIDDAISEVRSEFETFSSDPYVSYWQSLTRYRARSHHGGIAWKNAFYFWPVIPALDVQLTEAIRSIDGRLMLDRKLQKETFKAMAPDLATYSFASIGPKPRPLIHTARNRYHRRLEKIERRSLRFFKKHFKPHEKASNTALDCWLESERRAMSQIDEMTDILDTDKATKRLTEFFEARKKGKSRNRDQYSSILLTGGLCWLFNRGSKP